MKSRYKKTNDHNTKIMTTKYKIMIRCIVIEP